MLWSRARRVSSPYFADRLAARLCFSDPFQFETNGRRTLDPHTLAHITLDVGVAASRIITFVVVIGMRLTLD